MKKFLISLCGLAILLIVFLPSCSNNEEEIANKSIRTDIKLSESTRTAADNLQDFYLKFTTDLVSTVDINITDYSKNVVVSPLSASMVFGLLANGTDDISKEAILKYLGISDINALNALSQTMLTELPVADNLTNVALANSIWADNTLILSKNYSSAMEKFYNLESHSYDISHSDKLLADVNNWCSNHTNGLIKNFLKEISPNVRVIMLNAMYFNGIWAEKFFDPSKTHSDVFHGSEKDNNVEMMETSIEATTCYEDEYFQHCSLSFGNGAYYIDFFVLKDGVSLEEANRQIATSKQLSYDHSHKMDLKLSLPKFEVGMQCKLDDMLRAAGIGQILSNTQLTMFEDVYNGSLSFQQAASLKINEKGAEAAAVVEGEWLETAPCWPSGVIKINRPFYFFIREYSTQACILSGRITDL